ncbi:hypothetical protein JHK87_039944 [Glycine soja]|nr:hypothetical protein JHK87_039944 [Glycine soja]
MRRDAILAMQQKSGAKPSVFNRISEGPPLAEYAEDYQNMNILSDYAREDYFDDLSLSPKAIWVTQVSCFTPH